MGKVFLTYNNEQIQDGYFAQLQRIMAIRAIAKKYRFYYFHSEIINLTSTQLDTFQSEVEIQEYLKYINKKYSYKSDLNYSEIQKTIDLTAPTLSELILLRIKYMFSKNSVIVRITIPYKIIEKTPDSYKYSIDLLNKKSEFYKVDKKLIVIHARRGVAIQHIVPGERSVRALDDIYFLTKIKQIVLESKANLSLIILTDAPEHDLYYKPLDKDKKGWEQFNNYKSDSGILIQGHKFEIILEYFEGNYEIIRGGDIDRAIDIIRTAGYFVMSRSSMSFVGALLNAEGRIYYPPDFWHKPLKKWIS